MHVTAESLRLADIYERYGHADVQARWNPDNPGNRAIRTERTRAIARALRRAGWRDLASRRVLDLGCGSGRELARMVYLGARAENLHGVDLLPDRIAEARRAYPHIRFDVGDGAAGLTFLPDESFDLVLAMTVFSSVADEDVARRIAKEADRVLRPGGAVLWYDMRVANPHNPNVRAWSRHAIATWFPGFTARWTPITLAPPLARRLGRITPLAYPLLAAVPWLRTHALGWLEKPSRAFDAGREGHD